MWCHRPGAALSSLSSPPVRRFPMYTPDAPHVTLPCRCRLFIFDHKLTVSSGRKRELAASFPRRQSESHGSVAGTLVTLPLFRTGLLFRSAAEAPEAAQTPNVHSYSFQFFVIE